MVHGIGGIPGIIVIVIIIGIMNHHGVSATVITTMIPSVIPSMVIVIMTINANRHYRGHCKIRGVVGVMIRRIIWYIHR
jgi:hypothetical protein